MRGSLTAPIHLCGRLWRRWRFRRDPVAYARGLGVGLGEGCRLYGVPEEVFGSEPYLVRLGNHVSVTSGVRFVTHDGGVWILRDQFPDMDVVGAIVVGDNVFIGINSIILPGVTIGNNVLIGAGSVVTKDISDNCVVAGAPARVVRTFESYSEKALAEGVHSKNMTQTEARETFLRVVGWSRDSYL